MSIILGIIGVVVGLFMAYGYGKLNKHIELTKVQQEVFQKTKALEGMLSVNDLVLWTKDISNLFNIRKLIIYTIIIILIFSYGWFKGIQNKPVKIDLGYGKEALINIDKNTQLHIAKNGNVYLEDINGNILKQISVKDIPTLQAQLKPYGFECKIIGVGGYGFGNTSSAEAGAGLRLVRLWQARLDTFLTNKAAYLGIAYKFKNPKISNTSVGIGHGFGYDGENRTVGYVAIEFGN